MGVEGGGELAAAAGHGPHEHLGLGGIDQLPTALGDGVGEPPARSGGRQRDAHRRAHRTVPPERQYWPASRGMWGAFWGQDPRKHRRF